MFSIYTSDIPPSETQLNLDIYYVDDVNQVISYRTKSKRTIAFYTSRELHLINEYEKRSKIKGNAAKTKIIPISRRNTAEVVTPGNVHYEYSTEGRILGL